MNMKNFPIYINTLNIFRTIKTWWKHRKNYKFPKIDISCIKADFNTFKENFYTWYWWDHPYEWNFEKKKIIILIDDVQYTSRYGIDERESVPFRVGRFFNRNLLITFNSPDNRSNYEYWESLYYSK